MTEHGFESRGEDFSALSCMGDHLALALQQNKAGAGTPRCSCHVVCVESKGRAGTPAARRMVVF